jgi:hypothetical protein
MAITAGGRRSGRGMLVGASRGAGMPQGLRLGPARGPKALGVVAAVVLVAALVVTGRWMRGVATLPSPRPAGTAATGAPYRIGDRVLCPLGHPVLAMADGRSYPPGYPVPPPPEVEPVACYDTAAQAAAAGYAQAPLPAGVVDVGGVYLVPAPGRLRRQCRQAAGRLGFAVPCPALLPAPSRGAPPPGAGAAGSGFLLEDDGFVVPSGYVGTYRESAAHLAVGAARRPTAPAVACPGARPVAAARVRGSGARLLECPPDVESLHRDSLLLRWRERGTVMAVSVSGHSVLHRRVVLAVAAHLELVPPAG